MDDQREESFDGSRIRVLIVDDHPVVRAGLSAVLAQEPDMELVGHAENGEQAVTMSREHHPDVVLMDLRMPRLDGVEATAVITRELPDTRVLALTTYDGDADVRRALQAGARGYLLKDMLLTQVVSAVRSIHRGEHVMPIPVAERLAEYPEETTLTARELEVLRLVARGLSNREVARRIGRSEETVKAHLKHVFAKLEVSDRTEAVTLAAARGLLSLEDR